MTPIERIQEEKNLLYVLLKNNKIPPYKFRLIFQSVNKYIKLLELNEKANNASFSLEDVLNEIVNLTNGDLL